MSQLLTQIKKDLLVARRGLRTPEKGLVKAVLITLVGELQLEAHKGKGVEITDQHVIRRVKKFHSNNTATIERVKVARPTMAQRLQNENDILALYLPVYLSEQAIRGELLKDNVIWNKIAQAGNNGKAVGAAMGYLNNIGASVDGAVVAQVVMKIRSK